MKYQEAIRDLFKEAEIRLAAESSIGCPDVVPVWEAIYALIELKEISKEELEAIFKEDLLKHKEAPWELIQLCMYHLKLPKFKNLLGSQCKVVSKENDWRAIPVLHSILNAYENPWEDFELFYN